MILMFYELGFNSIFYSSFLIIFIATKLQHYNEIKISKCAKYLKLKILCREGFVNMWKSILAKQVIQMYQNSKDSNDKGSEGWLLYVSLLQNRDFTN